MKMFSKNKKTGLKRKKFTKLKTKKNTQLIKLNGFNKAD